MNCQNCGIPLETNALFCSHCGKPVKRDGDELGSESPAAPTYNTKIDRGYSRYTFVVSLVLMIILALNLLNSFATMQTLNEQLEILSTQLSDHELALFSKVIGVAKVEMVFIFLLFATTLTLMSVAGKIRKNAKNHYEQPAHIFKTQLYVSVAALLVSVAFVIYEIVAMSTFNSVMAELNLQLSLDITILVAPIAIAGLLIPTVLKSYRAR